MKTKVVLITMFLFSFFFGIQKGEAKVNGKPTITINSNGTIRVKYNYWNEKTGAGDYNMLEIKITLKSFDGNSSVVLYDAGRSNEDQSWPRWSSGAGPLRNGTRGGSGDWRNWTEDIIYNKAVYDILATYPDGSTNVKFDVYIREDDDSGWNNYYNDSYTSVNSSSFYKIPTAELINIIQKDGACNTYTVSWKINSNREYSNGRSPQLEILRNGTVTKTFSNISGSTSSSTVEFIDNAIYTGVAKYEIRYSATRNTDRIFTGASTVSKSFSALIHPSSVSSSFDKCNKAITLNLNMPKYVQSEHDASTPFNITRYVSSTEKGTFVKDATFDINFQTSSVISYEDSKDLKDGHYYYYEVKRHPWDVSCKKVSSSKVKADFTHLNPPEPIAKIITDTTGKKIKVTWTNPSALCGNTKLKLLVQNLSTGSEQTKNVGDGDTMYIMNSVQLCTKYAFSIVYSTANYGDIESEQSNTIIITDTLRIGNELNASKGYYTDRVSLKWSSPTPALIDDWVIERRELPNGEYSLVNRFANNNADVINYEDRDAQPGIIYQYKVSGVSKCADTNFRTPEIKSVGFRQPLGMVMGTITYGTGVAVKDVVVVAEVLEDNPYITKGKSMSFNGTSSYMEIPVTTEFISNDEFTIQFWVKPNGDNANKVLLSRAGQFEIRINADNKLQFETGVRALTSNSDISMSRFTHLSLVFNKNATKNNLMIYTDGRLTDSLDAAGISISGSTALYVGAKNATTEFFKGNIDDLRIWRTALSEEDIQFNYSAVLAGKENNLGLYIRGEEGVENLNGVFGEAYDLSYISYNNFYNANHAKTRSVLFDKDNIPTAEQLGYKGKADENGTYTIAAIPYAGSGTTYRITPMYDVHQFKPKNQSLFIGEGNIVHNKIDFEDISSFKVSGYVYYEGTNVGVDGVMFAVDGNTCVREGKVIETGGRMASGKQESGYYEIEVPIGFHSITASKHGHTFVSTRSNPDRIENSRFPGNELEPYDFQTEEKLDFDDVTKVELVGRFIGGPVEAGKPIGFGISKNNIGAATITLELQKLGYINVGADLSSTDTSSNGMIISEKKVSQGGGNIEVTVKTDPATGEFVAYLFPEEYKIAGTRSEIKVDNDLAGIYTKEYADPIVMQVNRKTVYLYDTDTMAVKPSATSENEYEQNTAEQKIIDSTSYHNEMNIVLRVNPTIEVLDYVKKDVVFGEREYVVVDAKTETILDTLMLVDENNNYSLTHPIFIQQRAYAMEVSVFEQYFNQDDLSENRVPTVDGDLIVSNTMAAINMAETDADDIDAVANVLMTGEVLKLDEKGQAIYAFVTGSPNITVASETENSYLKQLNFRVEFSDGTPTKKWRDEDMKTYVLGALSDGKDFVTRGPNVVDFILRDPPGSSSYAWIEEGSTVESTHEWGGRFEGEVGLNTELKFGMELTTWVGMGGGTATTVGAKNTTNIGLKTTQGGGRDNTYTTSYTFNKRIETSSDPLYTGTFGDIFIGSSYNIIFGEARMIDIFNSTTAKDAVPYSISGKSGKNYSIGSQTGITVTPQFQTDFQFTYHYIVFELIPDLEKIRNSFFTHYQENITENTTNNRVYYVSNVPIDHPDLGKDATMYTVVYPNNWADSLKIDSVNFYNLEIRAWEKLLAQNEREKVTAIKLKNLSFDAGVVYEETHTRDTIDAHTLVYEGSVNVDGNTQFGTDVAGVGVEFTISLNTKGSWNNNHSESETKTTTYGFHLEDGQDDDYYTVDILKPGNNSTAFRVLGGQSSCPYQDDEFAVYFEPEKQHVIHQGTARVEAPYLAANTASIVNVPGNQAANFVLTVGNNSMVAEAWYKLIVDEKTNPDGLELKIDGGVLTNGRIFLLDPTSSYEKSLSVRKTKPDINKYDSIRLVLHSQCQYDPANNREDIFSEVYISVEFLPSCTDLVVIDPVDNQIINKYSSDTLDIKVGEYDLSYLNFNNIILEYKPVTENSYTTIAYYYKNQAAYDAATSVDERLKNVIDVNIPVISQRWVAPELDGKYHIRARSLCPAGPVDVHQSITKDVTIIKDMRSPVPFGSAQPADGILSIGDDLLLTFNEDIQPNYSYRIDIQGELNGDELAHNSGLYFDGINDKMEVFQPMNLSGKSFTVEFWTLREGAAKAATLFSHGNSESKFEIGLTSDDKLQVIMNNNIITSIDPVTDINRSWTHISVVYDAAAKNISAYKNGNITLISSSPVGEYLSTGNIAVGTDFGKAQFYNGRVNELRVWTKALTPSVIYTQMNTKLSGTEIGLSAYWPMNESRGKFVSELIRGRNGSTNATWFVLPAGRALEFDGNEQYARTTILPEIESTADFSVEFWFRADEDNTNACLLSTGRGDNADFQASNKKFSIYFDESKTLVLQTSGKKEIIAKQLADADWHHLALSVNRRGNANVYIDSELKLAVNAADYFGMFSGINLWLGAMGWETNATTTTTDNYFKGNIDDLRIWKSALTRDGIKIASSSRLRGDEMGLRAYYPFDTTETATLIYGTLQDQLIASTTVDEKVNPNKPFELKNGADFTTTSANIKPCRMLKNVGFTRVYNDRQIYLEIDEPMRRIENCVLEISVSDVTDMHGNRLESPVKWTAFIDQNYLKWSEEGFSFVKDEFEPLSFNVKAINKSGSEQTFTIENLPSWLSASPSSGVIIPTGSVEITFVVNEGLNIGIYDENIYLKNSDGVNELLALDIRVVGNEPMWAVDPTRYDYSMNIFGQLEIEGIISSDKMDRIAAFNGEECVGVSSLTYQPEYDNYIAYLTVYGNTENTPLSFRIWDASTGRIYPQVLPDDIVFRNATFRGTPGNPVLFQALNIVEQNIALQTGWNWISTNVENDNMPNVNGAFSGYPFANNNEIKSQLRGFVRYNQGVWAGNLISGGGILNEEMYMVKVNNDGILTFVGKPVNPSTKSITINNGWTWIGYTPQMNLDVNEAFAGLNLKTGDLIKSQSEFSMYDEILGWLGNLNYLVPGKGYMLYTNHGSGSTIGNLTYPSTSSLTSHTKSGNGKAAKYTKTLAEENLPLFERNQSIVAEVISDNNEFTVDNATILYSYNGRECSGIAKSVWVEELNKYLFFLTVGGNMDTENMVFDVTFDNQKKSIVEKLTFKSNGIYGDIHNPIQLTIGERVVNEITVYPNPFMTGFTVSYPAPEGNTEITLVDVMGRIINKVTLSHETAATYSYEFKNLKDLAQGTYVIIINNANGVQTQKLIKQ